MVNLASCSLSSDELAVLQLGLGFCPLDPIHITEMIKDLYLFVQNLTYKFLFDSHRQNTNLERGLTERTRHFTMAEFCALRDLMLLYDESNINNISHAQLEPSEVPHETTVTPIFFVIHTFNIASNRFKPKSQNVPDLMTCPAIWAFLHQSNKDFKSKNWQDITPNLTHSQQCALRH